MATFYFSYFEHELFCWYFKRLHVFLTQCGYCVCKWKILNIVDEGGKSKTKLFWSIGVLFAKVLMRLGVCLSGLLMIHLHWRRQVAFLEVLSPILVHSILNLIKALFQCDLCSSSDHNISSCSIYACYAQPDSSFPFALCTRLKDGVSLLGLLLGLIGLIYVMSQKILLMWCIIQLRLLWKCHVLCMCMRSLLVLVVIMLFPIPLTIPMFLPCVYNLLPRVLF